MADLVSFSFSLTVKVILTWAIVFWNFFGEGSHGG